MIALTDRQGVTLERVGRRVRVALSPAGLPVMVHDPARLRAAATEFAACADWLEQLPPPIEPDLQLSLLEGVL